MDGVTADESGAQYTYNTQYTHIRTTMIMYINTSIRHPGWLPRRVATRHSLADEGGAGGLYIIDHLNDIVMSVGLGQDTGGLSILQHPSESEM